MNNIEILEEKIKIIESLCTDDCINRSTVIQPLKYAIENLILKNQDLKEKILRQQEQLNIANKKIQAQRGQLKVLNTSYIPKSKVKEKIEELEEEYKILQQTSDFIIADTIQPKIEVLQEFLEEGE